MPHVQSERRRAPRASVDLPLQLSTKADASPARLRNISQSGLCCVSDQAVEEMTLMGVQLDLPGHGPVEVQGAVVRCDKDREGEAPGYEIAIYFTEMSAQARIAIQNFVVSVL